jgi:3-oxoadipate enol-lactonase
MNGAHPVVAPEAPGFGARPTHAGWSIQSAAADVAGLIAAATPTRNAYVMGLSMGGYIALSLASRHPERIAGLILADTRADADDAAARSARLDAVSALASGGRTTYLSRLLPRLVGPSAPAEVRDELAACAERQPTQAFIDALRALADRPDRRADLAGIAVPTLVIVGSDDIVTPPAAARELARGITRAQLIEIPAAGHLTALERPALVADAVAGFLDHLPVPRRTDIPWGV